MQCYKAIIFQLKINFKKDYTSYSLFLFTSQYVLDIYLYVCLVAQSCPILATPETVTCQAPLSMGLIQTRILEWVALSFSRVSSRPRNRTQVFCTAGQGTQIYLFCIQCTLACCAVLSHSFISDSATPWAVHGILQARLLEWIAMPSFRDTTILHAYSQMISLILY